MNVWRQSPKQKIEPPHDYAANGDEMMASGAQVTKRGALDMQVCVPADWTDEQVKSYADGANLCGTQHGWHIRRTGDAALAGCAERVQCKDDPRFVHIMLDA